MKRTVRRTWHSLVAIPAGPQRRTAVLRRLVPAVAAVLFLAEAAVTIRFSASVGILLFVTTAGLAAFVHLGLQSLRPYERPSDISSLVDAETGLPGRQQLIDALTREIARTERYSQALTLAVIRVSQYEELGASWGAATARLSATHVAETLRRITRASDYVCRLDESSFAVILLQCTGTQASLFRERLSLAVRNRPLHSAAQVKVPLYVGVDVTALEYDSARFRGPLDFLSHAGGDVHAERPARMTRRAAAVSVDMAALRQEIARDYYPAGELKDFAEAYRDARSRNRHAG